MIPVRKLYKNFTATGNYVFVFPAAFDTIQLMVKFTGTDASDTLTVSALEKNAAGTVIEFVADGFPITGVIGTTGQIYLFDWKTPAMKVTFAFGTWTMRTSAMSNLLWCASIKPPSFLWRLIQTTSDSCPKAMTGRRL